MKLLKCRGQSSHIACSFSIVEIMTTLYKYFLHYPNNNLNDSKRDYLILSKGHGVMCQYACLNELGWISNKQIENYFSDGSELKGLSDSRIYGLEVTLVLWDMGCLWAGLAMAAKINNSDQRTYIIVGDGEINEGSIWEGLLFASHHELKNLFVIVDNNKLQAMGSTEKVLDLRNIQNKFTSFGFDAVTIDGHLEEEIKNCIDNFNKTNLKPKAIIANAIKGKGRFHGK